jgi:trehalose utilization protein
MNKSAPSRRRFLVTSAALAIPQALAAEPLPPPRPRIGVLIWDERQPAQKQAYSNFLGNEIAARLRRDPALDVKSAALDDPEQGLSTAALERARVLIWWGHVRNAEITPQKGREIVARILAGKLSLIALHSAHWSTPFVEAMNERTRSTIKPAATTAAGHDQLGFEEIPPPNRYTVPKRDAAPTPYIAWRKFPEGRSKAAIQLPFCCFPAYRNDAKPSEVTVFAPNHPIVAGIPPKFWIDQTEMYDEPFHVPTPDEVILEERWAPGEWFRSGMVWNIGKGKVFYFRPGHETFPVYKNPHCLKIVSNAVHWLAQP